MGNWYLMQANEQPTGPLTTETILARLARGEIQLTAQVAKFGGGSWQPIGQAAEFAATVRLIGPPPGAPAPASARDPADRFGLAEGLICLLVPIVGFGIGLHRMGRGWSSGAPMVILPPIAAVAIAGAAVGYGALRPRLQTRAQIQCVPAGAALADGYACTVRHTGGGAGRVCWALDIRCRNSTSAEPRECADVSPGSAFVVRLPVHPDAAAECDRVTSQQVIDVSPM